MRPANWNICKFSTFSGKLVSLHGVSFNFAPIGFLKSRSNTEWYLLLCLWGFQCNWHMPKEKHRLARKGLRTTKLHTHTVSSQPGLMLKTFHLPNKSDKLTKEGNHSHHSLPAQTPHPKMPAWWQVSIADTQGQEQGGAQTVSSVPLCSLRWLWVDEQTPACTDNSNRFWLRTDQNLQSEWMEA